MPSAIACEKIAGKDPSGVARVSVFAIASRIGSLAAAERYSLRAETKSVCLYGRIFSFCTGTKKCAAHLSNWRAVGSPPSASERARSMAPVDQPSSKSCAASLIYKAELSFVLLGIAEAKSASIMTAFANANSAVRGCADLRGHEIVIRLPDEGAPLLNKILIHEPCLCLFRETWKALQSCDRLDRLPPLRLKLTKIVRIGL